MAFFKFEGNWENRAAARTTSIKFELGIAVAVVLAALHVLFG